MGEKIENVRPGIDTCIKLLKTHPAFVDQSVVYRMIKMSGISHMSLPCIEGASCSHCSSEAYMHEIFSRATDQELEDIERYIKITVARLIYEGSPNKTDINTTMLGWLNHDNYLSALKGEHFYLNVDQVNRLYSSMCDAQAMREERFSLLDKCYQMVCYPKDENKLLSLIDSHAAARGFSHHVTTWSMLQTQTLADLRIIHRYLLAISQSNCQKEEEARNEYLQLQTERKKNLSPVTLGETQNPPPPSPTVPPTAPQRVQKVQGPISKDTARSTPITPPEATLTHPLEALQLQVIRKRQEFYLIHLQHVQALIRVKLPFDDLCNYNCEEFIGDFLKEALAPWFTVEFVKGINGAGSKVTIRMVDSTTDRGFKGACMPLYDEVMKCRDEVHRAALQYFQVQITYLLPNQDAFVLTVGSENRREYIRKALDPWFQVTVKDKDITIRLKEEERGTKVPL